MATITICSGCWERHSNPAFEREELLVGSLVRKDCEVCGVPLPPERQRVVYRDSLPTFARRTEP